MVVRNRQADKPENRRVEMAVRAVEANYRPSDLEVRDLDPSPTSLDLPAIQETAMCVRITATYAPSVAPHYVMTVIPMACLG